MERSRFRKVLYFYSITISIILVIIITYNNLKIIRKNYEKNIEILYTSTLDIKKNHIKNIVNGIIQQINIERENIIKDFENNIDFIAETLLKDESNIVSFNKNKTSNEYDFIIWDKQKQKITYTTKRISLDKHINSESDFINCIKKYKINRYNNMENKIIAIVVTDDIIEQKVQRIIKQHISTLEFSDKGYVWVNKIINYNGGDNYAIRLIHPNIVNTQREMLSTNTKDIKGNFPYKNELEGIKKNGDVFINYYFKKKGSNIVSHKISYAKLYSKYNWIVATGVYLDDIDFILKDEYEKLEVNLKNQIISSVTIVIFLSIIVGFIIYVFEKVHYKIVDEYYNFIIKQNSKLTIEKLKVEKEYKKLKSIATTDALTNLNNRHFMIKYLKSKYLNFKKRRGNYYLAIGDIDYFKKINDTYGHDAGDYVLKVISRILKDNIKERDEIARWGGEEFLILLLNSTEEDAIKIIDNIRSKIKNQLICYKGENIRITMSFGISKFEKKDKGYNDALERADKALYDSKKSGRNQVKLKV